MKYSDKIKEALRHPNKLGAGAAKRKKLHLTKDQKKKAVMAEFDRGTLHSGSGDIVKDPKQAYAIAMSESGQSRKKK